SSQSPADFVSLLDLGPPGSPPFPYTTLFRSQLFAQEDERQHQAEAQQHGGDARSAAPDQEALRAAHGRDAAHAFERQHLGDEARSEEHTSELHHVKISYAVFCLKKKKKRTQG